MNIPINCINKRQVFSTLVEVYNPILKLKKKEKEILTLYLERYDSLHTTGLPTNAIKEDLASTATRQTIRGVLKMSEPSFNNHIHQFKQKKVLVDGELVQLLASVIQAKDYSLTYQLKDV